MNVELEAPLLRLDTHDPSDTPIDQYDRRLVERAQAGDAEAFARLCGIYVERVFGYLCFHLHDEQAAEQLSAQVLVDAWLNIPCYEPGNPPFAAWLYLIARQTLLKDRERQGEGSIMEILSPEDKGLEPYETIQPCSNG